MSKLRNISESKKQMSDVERTLRDAAIEAELAAMQALAVEVAASWVSEKSGVELVEAQRR